MFLTIAVIIDRLKIQANVEGLEVELESSFEVEYDTLFSGRVLSL